MIVGYAYSYETGSYDVTLFKIHANGDVAWEKFLGDASDDRGIAVQRTVDGGFIVAGNTKSEDQGGIVLFKTDQTGAQP